MPKYKPREATVKRKSRKPRLPKRLPRDPNKLMHWAGRGTVIDYDKLRKLAIKARHQLPAYIDGVAFEKLIHVDRLTMIEEIQAAERHDISAGAFLDGLAWLLDKVPWGNWLWPLSASQSAIKARKGDSLNEVDEQYARLVGATYGTRGERPFVLDHWKRQAQFDSEYVSVWDSPDGHRLIAVRGTIGTATDVAEDILVGLTGTPLDIIGRQLLDILAATPASVTTDLAAHSLGTSLALKAYSDYSAIYSRIHETYLYAPAYSPFLRGIADKYERDSNIRYFINLHDAVSMGSLGHRAPKNVVFRSKGGPLAAHQLAQWQGNEVVYGGAQWHSPPAARLHAHKVLNIGTVDMTQSSEETLRVEPVPHEHPEHGPQDRVEPIHAEEEVTVDFG